MNTFKFKNGKFVISEGYGSVKKTKKEEVDPVTGIDKKEEPTNLPGVPPSKSGEPAASSTSTPEASKQGAPTQSKGQNVTQQNTPNQPNAKKPQSTNELTVLTLPGDEAGINKIKDILVKNYFVSPDRAAQLRAGDVVVNDTPYQIKLLKDFSVPLESFKNTDPGFYNRAKIQVAFVNNTNLMNKLIQKGLPMQVANYLSAAFLRVQDDKKQQKGYVDSDLLSKLKSSLQNKKQAQTPQTVKEGRGSSDILTQIKNDIIPIINPKILEKISPQYLQTAFEVFTDFAIKSSLPKYTGPGGKQKAPGDAAVAADATATEQQAEADPNTIAGQLELAGVKDVKSVIAKIDAWAKQNKIEIDPKALKTSEASVKKDDDEITNIEDYEEIKTSDIKPGEEKFAKPLAAESKYYNPRKPTSLVRHPVLVPYRVR